MNFYTVHIIRVNSFFHRLYIIYIYVNNDENVHRFGLSAIRGEHLERERESEKERERGREGDSFGILYTG